MDLSKLTPAPWLASAGLVTDESGSPRLADCTWGDVDDDQTEANCHFIALVRNDLDVKLRRGWHTEKCTDSGDWMVPQAVAAAMRLAWEKYDGSGPTPESLPPTADVFANCYQSGHDVGLLTKADVWYVANCENRGVTNA